MASERPSEPSNSQTHETLLKISTPALKNKLFGDKVTSLITGLQLGLTSIVNYPDGSNSLRGFPPFPSGTAGTRMAEYRLMDETIPEITFLNDSTMPVNDNDSALPSSAPPTPEMASCVNSPAAALLPPQLSSSADFKTAELKSLSKTMDSSLPSKSISSPLIANSVETSIFLRNNTFDCKPSPKVNGTVTLSETIWCDSNKSSKSSSADVSIQVTSPKENGFEVRTAELAQHQEKTSTHDITQEIQAADGAIVSRSRQSAGNAFDESLDLRMEYLLTSTPLTTGKLCNFIPEREAGKDLGAQKKLDQEGPSKPAAPVPSKIPSNLMRDLKLSQKQTLLPLPKVGSHLSKYKAASALPGPLKPATSGLRGQKQRTRVEALRNAPKELPGTSSPYNTSATIGSKLPISGQSGIKRAAPGVKLPPARGNVLSSQSLCGPPATGPVTRISQARKHPAPRVDMSDSKKMKMGCASCAALREKNKAMSEEIKRLKEDLLMFRRPEEK